MNQESLKKVAKALVAPGKGILAADESTGTIKKRFDKIGVESNEENRRAYRELLFTAPEISKYISGVILFDETLRQSTKTGVPFPQLLSEQGIIPGIKVDEGTVPLAENSEEKITKGLDGLDGRLKSYFQLGARFAKWRAVIAVDDELPSEECIKINAERLAEYARLCQEAEIVPIVEPEVLMDGSHTIERCFEVTKEVLAVIFTELNKKQIFLPGMLLKPNMVISATDAASQATPKQIADMTLQCFRETVPETVPGIVFLSGGQSEQFACETLNAINLANGDCPWELSFSYGRALQASALKAWSGKSENISAAQVAFINQAKLVSAARIGKYS